MIDKLEIDRIDALCIKFGIENYDITDDGLVDVDGDIDLGTMGRFTSLPLSFGNVSGDFYCKYNFLRTLKGCPKSVGGSFSCTNNRLTTLEFCPRSVGGDFDCSNNLLKTLEHCPITVGGYIEYSNIFLNTFEYFPKEFGDVMLGRGDQNLNILNSLLIEHFPKDTYGVSPFSDDYVTTSGEVIIFFKYMNYYDVWSPVFSIDNMMLLIADIKDGLK